MAAIDAHWDTAEGRTQEADRQAEEDELVGWLVGHPDVVVTSHGGWAPEQWRGGDLDDDGSFEDKEVDEGEVIAEGTTGATGYGRTPVERAVFITGLIRDHLRVQHCRVHTTERPPR